MMDFIGDLALYFDFFKNWKNQKMNLLRPFQFLRHLLCFETKIARLVKQYRLIFESNLFNPLLKSVKQIKRIANGKTHVNVKRYL